VDALKIDMQVVANATMPMEKACVLSEGSVIEFDGAPILKCDDFDVCHVDFVRSPRDRRSVGFRFEDQEVNAVDGDRIARYMIEIKALLGTTRMSVYDARKLATGAVVQLQQNFSDPVDIYFNGVLVARGEIVALDSNYGVKITEIVDEKERNRCRG
jgi:flagellar motor switch protein FliN